MGSVDGIGGFFFRARDPDALTAWYKQLLGIDAGQESIWNQQAGQTVFAPFPKDSDYFAQDRLWMLNLRVTGMDALLARLRAADIAVETRPEWEDSTYGRFARIHDPEGNPIELWEAPASETAA